MKTKKKAFSNYLLLLSIILLGNFRNFSNLFLSWHDSNFHLVGDHAVTFAGVAKVMKGQLWFGIPSFNDYWYPGPFWFVLLIPFKAVGILFAAPDVAALILLKIFINSIFLIYFYRFQETKNSSRTSTYVGLAFISVCLQLIGPMGSSLWDPFLIAAPIALVLFSAWQLQRSPTVIRSGIVVCCLGVIGSMSLVAYFLYILSLIVFCLVAAISLYKSGFSWKSLRDRIFKKNPTLFILANMLIASPWVLDGIFYQFSHLKQYVRYQKAVHLRAETSTSFMETFDLLKNMVTAHNSYLFMLILFIAMSGIVLVSNMTWKSKIALVAYFPFALLTAAIFIKFASSNFYSPDHPYYYLYFSLALNCAILISWLFSNILRVNNLSNIKKLLIVLPVAMALLAGLFFNRQTFNFQSGSATLLDTGVIYSKAFSSAVSQNQIKNVTSLPISIDFQDFNPSENIDNIELPWRFAVGWSEFLQTKGIKTCIVRSKNPIASRGNYIMTMYTYSNYCDRNASWEIQSSLQCNKDKQEVELIFHRGTRYALGPCKT